jgi:hypothetical protein
MQTLSLPKLTIALSPFSRTSYAHLMDARQLNGIKVE